MEEIGFDFTFEPFKARAPGEPGFRLSIPQTGRYRFGNCQEMDLQQGDQIEWDGKTWRKV